MMPRLRLAVLASGRGSNLQSLLDASGTGSLNADVAVVISDKAQALALERARSCRVPAYWINPSSYAGKKEFEEGLLEIIREHQADYIVLAGFMRVLSPYFIRHAPVPVLNIHPSLLPSFPGLHAQRQAVEYGVRFSGCTVHFVDEGVDSGPIILQAAVPVYSDDTEDTLAQRILQEEHVIYPRAIQLLSEGRVKCQGRKVLIVGVDEKND